MSIICKVCNREFKSIITNSHLKSHAMTTAEYVNLYGGDSLSSQEYRDDKARKMSGCNNPNFENFWSDEQKNNLSEKTKGRTPHNKGKIVTDEKSLANIKSGIEKREQKYRDGIIARPTYERTDEIRSATSRSVKLYAENNKEIMSDRSKKAAKTRKDNGSPPSMLGKTLSDDAKEKISKKSKENWAKKKILIREERIARMKEYGYDVISDDDVITFRCMKCDTVNSFSAQIADPCRINDKLCVKCHPRYETTSLVQEELFSFIVEHYPDSIQNYRGWYGKNEIDIFIPSLNIGFEYNGIYWHSQAVMEGNGLSKTRDFDKYTAAKNRGIRIYTIFEDEYKYKQDIVYDRIRSILGVQENTIYARKCEIREIDSRTANDFVENNHIQGAGRSNYRIGLFYLGELVSVMTFSNKEISRRMSGWEINRFVCKSGVTVVGGASKLFKHFLLDKTPEKVISYADTRWSDGNIYKKLGFKFDSQTVPNYWYFRGSNAVRIHRYTLRKKPTDNKDLTEYENRLLDGFDRVYDCGSTKWIWTDK